jgi:nucleotide-binding universal stress UspA family protein
MSPQEEHRPVVVGVDGSERALDAVRWAAGEAQAIGAPLQLIAALGYAADYARSPRGAGGNFYKFVVEDSQRDLNAAMAVARVVAPDLEVSQLMRDGHPATVLASESSRAALLVLGHRGRSGLPGLFAGSVAVALAATASCPVVVIRESATGPGSAHRPVVLGVDGSETDEAAIEFAFGAAARRGAPLVAVHAWLDYVVDSAYTELVDWDALQGEEEAFLAQRLAGWSAKHPEVAVRRVLVRDRPAYALLDHSAGAQLLVVGSRGRGAVSGTLLGSVSQAVLHHAPCPVVVVRPDVGGTG